MIIEDKGIILRMTHFQESRFIVKCFLNQNGVVKGLYRPNKLSCTLAPCNIVQARWSGKLGSLGYYNFEPVLHTFALVASSYHKMLIINSVIQLLDAFLQEGDAQDATFETTERFFRKVIAYKISSEVDSLNLIAAEYLLFELAILKESGFGLDLTKCVVSGQNHNLKFISPKSGCAVSAECAGPYESKLFRLPQFFLYQTEQIKREEILQGFTIINHFMCKHLLHEVIMKKPMYRDKLLSLFIS